MYTNCTVDYTDIETYNTSTYDCIIEDEKINIHEIEQRIAFDMDIPIERILIFSFNFFN